MGYLVATVFLFTTRLFFLLCYVLIVIHGASRVRRRVGSAIHFSELKSVDPVARASHLNFPPMDPGTSVVNGIFNPGRDPIDNEGVCHGDHALRHSITESCSWIQ